MKACRKKTKKDGSKGEEKNVENITDQADISKDSDEGMNKLIMSVCTSVHMGKLPENNDLKSLKPLTNKEKKALGMIKRKEFLKFFKNPREADNNGLGQFYGYDFKAGIGATYLPAFGALLGILNPIGFVAIAPLALAGWSIGGGIPAGLLGSKNAGKKWKKVFSLNKEETSMKKLESVYPKIWKKLNKQSLPYASKKTS